MLRVVQRFTKAASVARDGPEYAFVADGTRGRPRLFTPCPAVQRRVARERPHVVHVNGLVFPVQTGLLRRRLGPGPVLVAQNHAERPWRGWRGALQRHGLAAVDAFLFTAAAQATPWRAAGVIRAAQDVFEVLLADAPKAQLTMVFGEADLRTEVEARLAASPRLGAAVTLVGRVPHEELAAFYGSADYVVAASHHEGSGFAVAEALACRAVPIVTDIPSFVVMTDGGRFGALWGPGDAVDFVRAARTVLARPHRELSDAAIAHYRDHLSAAAIGRRALEAYAAVVARRGGTVS